MLKKAFISWRHYLTSPRFLILIISGMILLWTGIKVITHGLSLVDSRHGLVMNDLFHEILPPPHDFSTLIFFLTYSSVFFVLIEAALFSPVQVMRYCLSIGIMKLLRTSTMFLFPLEPPKGIILLHDPIVTFLTPNHMAAAKDLFFSGHAATMMILLLCAVRPETKWWMRMICLVVPVLILWQRVHYTIDIVAGLVIGAVIYKMVALLTDAYLQKDLVLSGKISVKR